VNDRFTKGGWNHFAGTHWEQSPLVAPLPGTPPPLDETSLLPAVLDAVHPSPELRARPFVRVFFGDRAVVADLPRYLPERADGDLAGYADRMGALADGGPWALVVNNLQITCPELWRWARDLLGDVYDAIGGMPAGFADLDVFVGHYAATPFGVHTDPASNFMFPILGPKGMRVWPADAEVPLGSLRYETARDAGVLLEPAPGEFAYWPSSYQHVGESPGGVSASLNIGLNLEEDAISAVSGRLRRAAAGHRPARFGLLPHKDADAVHAATAEVEAAFARAAGALADGASTPLDGALRRITGAGFREAPAAAPLELPPEDDAIRLRPRTALLVRRDGADLVVSANGRSMRLAADGGVERALERLARGETVAVMLNNLDAAAADRWRAAVARLGSWRAVEVLPQTSSAPAGQVRLTTG
jgi:hypothetical protein